MSVLAPFVHAMERLRQAAASALRVIENEDTRDIDAQAERAVALATELAGALSKNDNELALKVLHGVNNKLAGVLSLTALSLEDCSEAQPEARSALQNVQTLARDAAMATRELASVVKGESKSDA